jgi:hypothetical protein
MASSRMSHGVTSQKTPFFKIWITTLRGGTNLLNPVRFEVFTAVTMKNGVFWDVTPCGSCKNLFLSP